MRFGSAALAALSFPFVTHGKKSFSDEGRGTAVSEHPFYDATLSYIFPGFDSTKKLKDPPPSIEKYTKKQGVLRNVQPDAAIEKDPSSEAKLQKIDIDIGILGSLHRTDSQQDGTAPQHFQSAQDVYSTEQYYDEEYSFNAAEDVVSMYDPYGVDGGALGSESIELGQRRMTPTIGCPDPRPVVNETGDLSGGFEGDLRTFVKDCYSNSPYFADCPESYKNGLQCWNMSLVTDLSYATYKLYYFNDDIGGWDVSKVFTMGSMFDGAFSFNADISPWKVGNVQDMMYMFFSANYFNGAIGGWDVSKVSLMSDMFREAYTFNQNISRWQVGNVKYMDYMFYGAFEFNGAIGGWDVSKVSMMSGMFATANAFNQDISPWQVGNVEYMERMFYGAFEFNGAIGGWDVSKVSTMSYMFYEAYAFNQDISPWQVGNVQDMDQMFFYAHDFDQNLGTWADQVRIDVYTYDMFSYSGCPYQDDPKPGEQPWCSYGPNGPTGSRSRSPSRAPSSSPSEQPSRIPSSQPSLMPSLAPSESQKEVEKKKKTPKNKKNRKATKKKQQRKLRLGRQANT